jgi:hypothetical protein
MFLIYKRKYDNKVSRLLLAITIVVILVPSTTVAKPALVSNSVTKSNTRDVSKFLKCIAYIGENDISKVKLKSALIIAEEKNNKNDLVLQ